MAGIFVSLSNDLAEPFGCFFRIEESGNQTITEFRVTAAN